MSSEVCPFCGKAFKRLKSHLPHCKAAPPTSRDVTAPSHLAAPLSDPAAEGKKSAQTLIKTSKKSKKVSEVSSSPAASSSQSLSASYASLSSPKKRKQKSSEQIESANVLSSDAVSVNSTPSLPPSPISSKPKKKSLRALIEAAKSKEVSNRSIEGIRSASEDLPSGSTPLSSKSPLQTETETNPDFINDSADPAFLQTDTKPKRASKTKGIKTKTSAREDTSSSLDSKVDESRVQDDLLVSNEWEISDSSAKTMKSQSGHQAKITIQNVKSVLGKANATRKSSRPGILSQMGTTNDLSIKVRPGVNLSRLPPQSEEDVDSSLVTSKTVSDQLLSTGSQNKPKHDPKSAQRKSSKSKPASLIPLQNDASPPPQVTSPPPGRPSTQVIQSASPPHAACVDETLKAGRHMTGLLSAAPSLNQLSSPHLFPLAKQNLPARVEALRADDGRRVEKLQLELRKGNAAANGDALTQRSLGQVRLRELPEWLACRTPGDPKDVVKMVQRGWQWYYRRYIDVKRGGVGGLSMLLAGYCVLSYMWCYPHIKRDRWRKHH